MFRTRTANDKKICEALKEVVLRWDTPKLLLMNNGTEFVNQTLQSFASEHGITHTTVPPYHPQANSVKHVNRILKTMIVAFLEWDSREWDKHLKDFRFAYNTAHHSSIGASPALLNLGRELEPSDTLRMNTTEVESRNPAGWSERKKNCRRCWAENLEQAYQKQFEYYNLQRRNVAFRVGDLVLKRQHVLSSAAHNVAAKLSPKFRVQS